MFSQQWPRIPDSVDQFSRNAIAQARSEKDCQCSAFFERRTPALFLLEGSLIEKTPDFFRTCFQHLLQHAGIEWARSNRVNIDTLFANLLRKCFHEADDRRFRGGVGTESRQ